MGQRYSKIKYMLLGAIITVLASQSIVPTAASMVGKTINVYTGISVYVDDQEIIPTDVNGNRVDVFYYNGTTYLPARAISKVFGKPIQWEGKTQSIYIGSHKSDKPAVWLQELDYFTGNDLRVRDNVKDNMGNPLWYDRRHGWKLHRSGQKSGSPRWHCGSRHGGKD